MSAPTTPLFEAFQAFCAEYDRKLAAAVERAERAEASNTQALAVSYDRAVRAERALAKANNQLKAFQRLVEDIKTATPSADGGCKCTQRKSVVQRDMARKPNGDLIWRCGDCDAELESYPYD